MKINFFRSSSFGNWFFCEMQYFLTYNLGIPKDSNKKADVGTATHKVMECLAKMKKARQDTGKFILDDNVVGKMEVSEDDFYGQYKLTSSEISTINSKRNDRWTYLSPCKVNPGHVRYGKALVEYLISKSTEYYAPKSVEEWKEKDFDNVTNFTWMTLDYMNGAFDPRRLNIVEPEKRFEFVIEKDWAKLPDGGYLGIKGTVDLVTTHGDGILEVIDWKTGQRKDWGKNVVKDYNYLGKDFQLMLYYYALNKIMPNNHISVSIFFIRDGGPYTLNFEPHHLDIVEETLAKQLKTIQECKTPMMIDPTQKDVKCAKMCSYKKLASPDGTNMCRFIHDKIYEIGIDKVENLYKHDGHVMGHYESPGE